jgi:hypothetical protein
MTIKWSKMLVKKTILITMDMLKSTCSKWWDDLFDTCSNGIFLLYPLINETMFLYSGHQMVQTMPLLLWWFLGWKYKWHNYNFETTAISRIVFPHTNFFGLMSRTNLVQVGNLCCNVEMCGVMQQLEHVWAIWWLLLWAFIMKSLSTCYYLWQSC